MPIPEVYITQTKVEVRLHKPNIADVLNALKALRYTGRVIINFSQGTPGDLTVMDLKDPKDLAP